ncbi:hypothetical protein HDU97_009254 [Phlyctochytrium planicorne]|nr:hypothetical protein HDU97_009254 [Phlyctochytrium planicorne]
MVEEEDDVPEIAGDFVKTFPDARRNTDATTYPIHSDARRNTQATTIGIQIPTLSEPVPDPEIEFNAPSLPQAAPVVRREGIKMVLLKLAMFRFCLFVPLLGLIVVTHTNWWMKNVKHTVFLFQSLTAVTGFLVTLLLGECCWMVQGAIASAWNWRPRGKRTAGWWEKRKRHQALMDQKHTVAPLVVAEGIQTGRPGNIFGVGATLNEFLLVMAVPIMATAVTATYKFGIGVGVTDKDISTVISTSFLSVSADHGALQIDPCSPDDEMCSVGKIQPRFGVLVNHLDYLDYSWAPGVDFGYNVSKSAFRMVVGDVPSISDEVRATILGGVRYQQETMDIVVDCGRDLTNPYPNPCSTATPFRNIDSLSACSTSASTISGVINFTPNSLGLSCQYNLTLFMRSVNAKPEGSSWVSKAIDNDRTLPGLLNPDFWNIILPDFSSQVGNGMGNSIDIGSPVGPCFWGCRKVLKSFQIGVATKMANMMTQQLFGRSRFGMNQVAPLPGVCGLKFQQTVRMLCPSGEIVVRGMNQNTILNIGTYAVLNVSENEYAYVNFWVVCFLLLPFVEMMAALVKWRYACHPKDAICGVLWSLNNSQQIKVNVLPAGAASKLQVRQVVPIERTTTMVKDG